METTRSSRHPAGATRHLHVVGSRNAAPEQDHYWGLTGIVGGLDALWTLDAAPIPDEPFDWSGVEARDRLYVDDVLHFSDMCCDELLDVEYRTIARRILARVATHDCGALRRSRRASRSAAGLVWLATQASCDPARERARSSQYLWSWFGVSNASERGRALRIAAGFAAEPLGPDRSRIVMVLGDPAFLHSRYRARIIRRRDAIVELRRELAAATAPEVRTAPRDPITNVITPRFGGSKPA
jgi:hypothetical protein